MPIFKNAAIAALITLGTLTASVPAQTTTTIDPRIRLNTVGFLPGFPKQASVAAKFTAFALYDAAASGVKIAYRPTEPTVDSVYNSDTREELWIADFSEFTTPGKYYLYIPNIGRSPDFTIANDVFVEPYRALMLGFYLWRCGTAVSASYGGKTYSHAACHLNDGGLQYYEAGRSGNKDGKGGWHDAGDYNKYTVNSGAAVAFTLKAWEHFWHVLKDRPLVSVPNAGELPAFLSEVKWNLDWVAKMQFPDGRVSHKLSTLGFGGDIMPNNESTARYFAPWSTAATGSFVGQMAIAARLYRAYDPQFANACLEKARLSYRILMDTTFVEETQDPFSTGAYGSSHDNDKRLWAAVEMWETTGEPEFLEYAESKALSISSQITWASVNTVAALTYLNSARGGRNPERVESLRNSLVNAANNLVDYAGAHGYSRNISLYNWGANGTVAGTAYVLHSAYRQTGDEKYRHTIQDVLAYLLGRNYYGRSFVTGVGHNPPKNPHDRTSTASKTPWPGRLIGGPHRDKENASSTCTQSPATCWEDIAADYWTNEVAINWNAPMAYALAAAMPGAETLPAPKYPGQPEEQTSIRHTKVKKNHAAGAQTARVVRVQNGRLDIPPGAKVYGLDGRLLAQRGLGSSAAPAIRKNGVFIVRFDNGQ